MTASNTNNEAKIASLEKEIVRLRTENAHLRDQLQKWFDRRARRAENRRIERQEVRELKQIKKLHPERFED